MYNSNQMHVPKLTHLSNGKNETNQKNTKSLIITLMTKVQIFWSIYVSNSTHIPYDKVPCFLF